GRHGPDRAAGGAAAHPLHHHGRRRAGVRRLHLGSRHREAGPGLGGGSADGPGRLRGHDRPRGPEQRAGPPRCGTRADHRPRSGDRTAQRRQPDGGGRVHAGLPPGRGVLGEGHDHPEVTDGAVGDPSAATATLAIPVEVEPEETNLPPTFQGALLEVEQGGPASSLDLSAGAEDPEDDELSYALGEYDEVPGVSLSLEGSDLTVTATSKAAKGTVVDVPVTVSDGTNPDVPATVQITVGSSQRPLISPALDEVQIDAGRTEEIDVLANDSNPFPGGERTVTGASLVSGDGEVEVTGNKVTITPASDYHGILTAEYRVLDDTG